jgi:hypothetical protein
MSDVLQCAGMLSCKPASTPLSCSTKISTQVGERLSLEDATRYRSIIGALQYLILTRPDIFLHSTKFVNICILQPQCGS